MYWASIVTQWMENGSEEPWFSFGPHSIPWTLSCWAEDNSSHTVTKSSTADLHSVSSPLLIPPPMAESSVNLWIWPVLRCVVLEGENSPLWDSSMTEHPGWHTTLQVRIMWSAIQEVSNPIHTGGSDLQSCHLLSWWCWKHWRSQKHNPHNAVLVYEESVEKVDDCFLCFSRWTEVDSSQVQTHHFEI